VSPLETLRVETEALAMAEMRLARAEIAARDTGIAAAKAQKEYNEAKAVASIARETVARAAREAVR
jgi:hypothetical protein